MNLVKKPIKSILTLLSTMAFCQVFGQINLDAGIKMGATIPSFTVKTEGTKDLPGLSAGVTSDIGNNNIGAIIEVLYNSFGLSNSKTGNLELGYVSVPILFRRSIGKVIQAQVGPEFSFLVSSKASSGGQSENAKYLTNNFDIGLGGGFRLKPVSFLFLDARAMFGLNKVYTIADSKVTRFNIAVGVLF